VGSTPRIALAGALDAPLVASGYSRPGDRLQPLPGGEGSTPEVSDGTLWSANKGLTKEQVDAAPKPASGPITARLTAISTHDGKRRQVALLVMHSFTPQIERLKAPLGRRCAVERRLPAARALLAELRRDRSLVVGDNEPYSRAPRTNTRSMPMRGPATAALLAGKWRQDLIDTSDTARAWGRRLAPAIRDRCGQALS